MPKQTIVISYCDFEIIVYEAEQGSVATLKTVITNQLSEFRNNWFFIGDDQLFYKAVKLEFHEWLRANNIAIQPQYPSTDRGLWKYTDTVVDLYILLSAKDVTEVEQNKDFNDILNDPNEGQEVQF